MVLAAFVMANPLVAGPFDKLLNRVPDYANAIVLINVKGLHQCRLGMKEDWAKKHEDDYRADVVHIPPTVDRVLLATQLNPGALADSSVIAVADLSEPVNMERVARKEDGSLDQVAGKRVVLSRRDAYFVEFSPQSVGTMRPANRQELTRWLKFAQKNARPAVSSYLRDAVENPDAPYQVLMAVDLTDFFDPQNVKRCLALSRVMSAKRDYADTMAKTIMGLKGMRLTIQVDNAIRGKLTFDFAEPALVVADLVKPLFLEWLGEKSASIDDLEAWTAHPEGKSIVLEGKLSKVGAKQILSLIPAPMPRVESAGAPGSDSEGADPKAVASKRYFKAISSLLDEARAMLGDKRASFHKIAFWHEKYSKEIDELPMLNVDPDLLTYGQKMSSMLRALAQSLRGVDISTAVLQKYKTSATVVDGGYAYYGGYYGGYYPPAVYDTNNYAQIKSVQDQMAFQGVQARDQVWRMIDDSTVAIRRQMVEKYKIEF
jgi:hypothetical protein